MSDDDKRLTRVEEKVDKINDKVDQTREDMHELRTEFKVHATAIQQHIQSDNKIVTELKPFLDEMAYRRMRKQERKEKWKSISTKVGVLAAFVSMLFGITRMLG